MSAILLNPKAPVQRWTCVAANVQAGTEVSFSMKGYDELIVVANLFGANYEWFEIAIPRKDLLVSTYRNFNFGHKDWALAFSARISGDTVTCKLTNSADANSRMYVYAR